MKFKTMWLWTALAVLVWLVAACAAPGVAPVPTPAPQAAYGGEYESAPAADEGARAGLPKANASEERMIVRTADLSLVVGDAEAAAAQIKSVATGLGGYVVSTQLWREEEQLRGSITVRVPAESLDDALDSFKRLAIRVERESGSSRDVTEEYTDLDAQLRNLEATEQELRELLGTVRERTGKAEDILAVHRELTSIRAQIEQLKGRMQYLERTAALSAVSIELIPDVLARPIASGGWRPSETASAAVRALVDTLRLLAGAAIWVALYVLPIAALVAIPLVVLWLLWKRRRREVPTASDQAK
jgi:hypothetical protein